MRCRDNVQLTFELIQDGLVLFPQNSNNKKTRFNFPFHCLNFHIWLFVSPLFSLSQLWSLSRLPPTFSLIMVQSLVVMPTKVFIFTDRADLSNPLKLFLPLWALFFLVICNQGLFLFDFLHFCIQLFFYNCWQKI